MSEKLTAQDRANCPQLASRPSWRWLGPCHKGHMQCVKAVKRREAQQRNMSTAIPDNRQEAP